MKKSSELLSYLLLFSTLVLITLKMQSQPSNLGHLYDDTQESCKDFQSQMNVSLATQDEINAANDLMFKIQSRSPDFHLQEMITSKNIKKNELIHTLLITSAPWIVFLILSVLGWFIYSLMCVCNRCCSSCKKKHIGKHTRTSYMVPLTCTVFFALIIIASSIAGLVIIFQYNKYYSETIGTGIVGVRCSLIQAVDDFIDPSSQFIGLDQIQQKFVNLADKLVYFVNETDKIFNVSSPKSKSMIKLENNTLTQIQNMATSKFNPVILTVRGNGSDSDPYQSFYSKQNVLNFIVGAASSYNVQPDQQTYLKSQGINKENLMVFGYYDILITILTKLEKSAIPLLSGQNLKSQIEQGIRKSQDLVDSISNFGLQLYQHTQIMTQIGDITTKVVQAFFGVSLASSCIVIIGAIIVTALKQYNARLLLHIGWCVYCIVMILGFAIGGVLYPATVVSAEACDYYYSLIHDQTVYLNSTLIPNAQVKSLVNECIYEGGDLPKILGVKQSLSELNLIVSNLSELSNMTAKIRLIQNGSYLVNDLKSNKLILQDLSDGSIIDQDTQEEKSQNVLLMIKQFNQFSSLKGCVQLKRLNGSCTDGTTPVMTSSQPYSVRCWHPTLLVKQRDFNQLCVQQQSQALSLQNWFKSQEIGWSPIVSQQDEVIKVNNKLNTAIWNYISEILKYQKDVIDFLMLESDPQNVVINDLNCSFLKTTLQRIYNGYCVLFTPAVYRTTILISIISFAMFCGSLSTCCLGFKFQKISDKKKSSYVEANKRDKYERNGSDYNRSTAQTKYAYP